MRKSFNLLVILLSVMLLAACDDTAQSEVSQDKNPDAQELSKMYGAELGDDIDYVMERVRPHVVSEMPDEITARIPLNMKDSTFYDIDYDFKNGSLYSIDLDIYPKSISDCMKLYGDFKSFYNKSYGAGSEDQGYIVWYTKTKAGQDVEITMIDESKSHKKPYLAITFYQEDGIDK